eukprot:5368674-Alexandrium_andersonii.AAC.1
MQPLDTHTTIPHVPMPVRSGCLFRLDVRGDLPDRAVLPRPIFDVSHVLSWPGRSERALPGMGTRRR